MTFGQNHLDLVVASRLFTHSRLGDGHKVTAGVRER